MSPMRPSHAVDFLGKPLGQNTRAATPSGIPRPHLLCRMNTAPSEKNNFRRTHSFCLLGCKSTPLRTKILGHRCKQPFTTW